MNIQMTQDEWQDARDNYVGWCRSCGRDHDSCEPDARNYPCDSCGKSDVYGAEEWLINDWIEFV